VSRRSDIARVIAGLEELARGNLAHRVSVSGSGQAADLAEAVNRLADSIQDARAEALRRDAAHKQLISNLSHDLRTPITSIAGYVDALQRGLGEDPERHLDTLAVKSAELTRLADDLFYLTKLDAGDLSLEIAPLDLGEAVRQVLLGFERELVTRGVEVAVDIPDGPCAVAADEAALKRIVGNFVANSLKHARGMTRFGITVQSDGPSCTVAVWDDGSGFSKGVAELLERGASVGPGGGSGLGLSIAHDLTERMGGSISAESAPGVRTQVSVTFPLVDGGVGAS
jgi:signal transduction histidine kinase